MSKVIRTITPCDWFKNFAPATQSIICKPKTNGDLITLVSPHLAMVEFFVFATENRSKTTAKLVKAIYWKTALNKTFVMFPADGKREKERTLALNRARPSNFPRKVEVRQKKANPDEQSLTIRLMTANMKALLKVRVPLSG